MENINSILEGYKEKRKFLEYASKKHKANERCLEEKFQKNIGQLDWMVNLNSSKGKKVVMLLNR